MTAIAALQRIYAETLAKGFTYFQPGEMEHAEELSNKGLVQINAGQKNEMGFHAVRSTDMAENAILGATGERPQPAPASAPTVGQAMGKYAIEKDVPKPAATRGFQAREKGPSEYPFEHMEPGDSFFIPATATDPEPHKRHGAAMSRANKDMWPRRFSMSKVPGGARCHRIADDTADAPPEPRKRAPRTTAPVNAPVVPQAFSAGQAQPFAPPPATTLPAPAAWGSAPPAAAPVNLSQAAPWAAVDAGEAEADEQTGDAVVWE